MTANTVAQLLNELERLCVEYGMKYLLVDEPDRMNDTIYVVGSRNTVVVDKSVTVETVQAAIGLFTEKAVLCRE